MSPHVILSVKLKILINLHIKLLASRSAIFGIIQDDIEKFHWGKSSGNTFKMNSARMEKLAERFYKVFHIRRIQHIKVDHYGYF